MTSFPLIQTTDPGTSQYMIIPGGYICTEAVQVNGLNYLVMIPGNTAHTIQRQDQAAGVSDFLRPVQASHEADKLSPAQPPMPETDNEPAGLKRKRKTDDNQDELSRLPRKQLKVLSEKELEELRSAFNQPGNERRSDTELAVRYGVAENTIYKYRNKMKIFKEPASEKKHVFLPPEKELELMEELEKTGNMPSSIEELADKYGQCTLTMRKRIIKIKHSPQLAVELKKRELQRRINVENEFKKIADGTAKKSIREIGKEFGLRDPEVEGQWRKWRKKTQIKPAEPAKTVPGTTGKEAAKLMKSVSGTTVKGTAKPPKPVSGTAGDSKTDEPVSGTSGKGAAQPPVVNWLINDLSPAVSPARTLSVLSDPHKVILNPVFCAGLVCTASGHNKGGR